MELTNTEKKKIGKLILAKAYAIENDKGYFYLDVSNNDTLLESFSLWYSNCIRDIHSGFPVFKLNYKCVLGISIMNPVEHEHHVTFKFCFDACTDIDCFKNIEIKPRYKVHRCKDKSAVRRNRLRRIGRFFGMKTKELESEFLTTSRSNAGYKLTARRYNESSAA